MGFVPGHIKEKEEAVLDTSKKSADMPAFPGKFFRLLAQTGMNRAILLMDRQ